MSGGSNEVQATFWLLNAPTSLVSLSETQPDGVGLGTFNRDGTPWVYRKPVAASRSQTFIADAHRAKVSLGPDASGQGFVVAVEFPAANGQPAGA